MTTTARRETNRERCWTVGDGSPRDVARAAACAVLNATNRRPSSGNRVATAAGALYDALPPVYRAAPDLLAACEEALGYIGTGGQQAGLVFAANVLRSAIAAAKGQ